MNESFAQVVFPVMNLVLEQEQILINKFDSPQKVTSYDVRKIQENFKQALDRASADLEGAEEWERYARYALVAWIDSLMIANPFVGPHWQDLVLENRYFDTRGAAYDEFYRRCEDALRKGLKNAVEVFFLCFMLGFRGVYNDPQAAARLRDLPPSGREWQKRYAKIVVANQTKTQLEPQPALRFDNAPQVGFRHFLTALLAFLFFLTLLVVVQIVIGIQPK